MTLLACMGVQGCGSMSTIPLPNENTDPVDQDRFTLLARFAHITDSHIVDEESPGRLTTFSSLSHSAWRPHEAFATQLLDGTIRAINKIHVGGHRIDFVVHTGDATDNAQENELAWFVTCMDGGGIDPLTGIDDRVESDRPDALSDPHAPFVAQGLYRNGVHGDAPSIPWYVLLGNHDHFAAGVFPIVTGPAGRRTAPLPIENRLGLFAPLALNPTGSLAHAPVSPAHEEPARETQFPVHVTAREDRRFITDRSFVEALLGSETSPTGHGFSPEREAQTWYSVAPVPGLRLIALNSSSPPEEQPTLVYSEGAISLAQVLFLKRELAKARDRGEYVILATHHPRRSLRPELGSWMTSSSLAQLLDQVPRVAVHIAGHVHHHDAYQVGGHVELITASVIDAPQQGRIIEIWVDGDEVELRYRFFSHLDELETPADLTPDELAIFEDPLQPMRARAATLAACHELRAPCTVP